MLKALFVGDPHYGRQPSYLPPGMWRKNVTHMLDAALAAALRAGVDCIVIVGDIFDHNNPHPLDHAEFTDWLFRAKEAGMQVIIIPGNHDYGDADYTALEPYTRMRDTVKVITKPTTTTLKHIPVRFYPWSPPDVQHKIGDIKGKKPYLIVHHEEIKGAKMDNGWLADGFVPRAKDFLVGGHLHTHQWVGKRAIYVGTALPHHWNHNVKGFTIIKAEMKSGKLVIDTAQAPYIPPFFLRELTLKEYKKEAPNEKRLVYYRVIARTGVTLPDDLRIVSRKFIGDKEVANDNKSKPSALSELPSPVTWFLDRMNLPDDKRKRAMKVLSNLKVEDEA